MQAELERKTRRLELLNTKLGEEVAKEVEKRRKSEQQMYQQSRLAAMGQLIVAISHNWRNPLNSLGLLIQDLEDAYAFGELDHAYLKDMSKKSLVQINFMSQTIDDFANFFKPVGQQETFHIRRVIYNTIIDLEDDLADKSITLKESAECSDFEITGYPDDLQKVLENLVGNAKDAIEEKMEKETAFKGEITLSYNASPEGNYILVADNGGGIPEEIIDKVFDPYYTTKEQGKGTGLGLYMSKIIIENNMNGKLTVKNGEAGAVFKIGLF
jgi:signal transduction histidine kinase